MNSINLDFSKLDALRTELTLRDSPYIEYIFNKLFDNPTRSADTIFDHPPSWAFPECWIARYYLYYHLHKHFLTNQTVFEIGTNLNFYAVWSILNGAQLVDGIEPSTKRYYLAKEYAKIRAPGKISTQNVSIDEYMHSHCDKQYDVVMFLDVFYYLQNGVEVLKFIRDRLKPKYLFFETTVVDDYCEPGHMQVEYSTTDPLAFKSFTTSDASQTLGFIPSRNALKNIFADQGWEIVTYYNYADFVGRGESGPRRRGQKDFYVLKNSA